MRIAPAGPFLRIPSCNPFLTLPIKRCRFQVVIDKRYIQTRYHTMSTIHPTRPFKQRDAWLSILLLGLSGFVLWLFPVLQSLLPGISISTSEYISVVPIHLIPIIYLSFRYGWVGISDFWLRGADFVVLAISFIIVSLTISIISLVTPYISSVHSEVSQLPRPEYLITLLIYFLIGPFLEETLFRKYIFEIFRSKYSILVALLLTAFVETLMHIGYWHVTTLIVIFLLTLFFTLIYTKSRLGVSIIMHCLTNVFIVLD